MTFAPTPLSLRFRLDLPLIVAPMAGGPSTTALAAAVANSGGLGSLGLAYTKPQEIPQQIADYRKQTSFPVAVNLFVPMKDPFVPSELLQKALTATHHFRERFHLPEPTLKAPFSENFDLQFEALLACKPEIFTFTFGVLDKSYLKACHQENIFVMGTATTPEEALALEESGVDALILQGCEGGGHRGIFDETSADPLIPALELTRHCRQKTRLPLVTAGGLMTGADIANAIKAGAEAAQLGTAFLMCAEAGTSAPYRRELQKKIPGRSRLTRAFSGRLARGLENQFMREMDQHADCIMPFPAQNVFTRDLRKASAASDSADMLSLWAGSSAHQVRPMKTNELMTLLKREFEKEML